MFKRIINTLNPVLASREPSVDKVVMEIQDNLVFTGAEDDLYDATVEMLAQLALSHEAYEVMNSYVLSEKTRCEIEDRVLDRVAQRLSDRLSNTAS